METNYLSQKFHKKDRTLLIIDKNRNKYEIFPLIFNSPALLEIGSKNVLTVIVNSRKYFDRKIVYTIT